MADLLVACRNLMVSEHPHGVDNLNGRAIVHLLHYSVREFFVRLPHIARIRWQHYLLEEASHIESEIAKACMAYLRLCCLNRGPAQSFIDLRVRLAEGSDPFTWCCAQYFEELMVEAPVATQELLDQANQLRSLDG